MRPLGKGSTGFQGISLTIPQSLLFFLDRHERSLISLVSLTLRPRRGRLRARGSMPLREQSFNEVVLARAARKRVGDGAPDLVRKILRDRVDNRLEEILEGVLHALRVARHRRN